MIIQFVNQQTKFPVKTWKELLRQVLPAAMAELPFGRQLLEDGCEPAVTITFAGSNVMRRVNRETRQVDSLTDVLSFPLLDMCDGQLRQPLAAPDFDLDVHGGKALPLGEILISLDRAISQAADYGHSNEREVAFLAIHGFLHLLGFDHLQPARESKMMLLQDKILQASNMGRDQHE